MSARGLWLAFSVQPRRRSFTPLEAALPATMSSRMFNAMAGADSDEDFARDVSGIVTANISGASEVCPLETG